MNSPLLINKWPFLKGGGEMGKLINNYDWASTSLGSIDRWPANLKIILGNIVHSAFPMFLFWGPELICFYNDAYRPSLGNNGKHPAIGKKAKEVWPEIWDFIGPMISQVMQTGKATSYSDQLLPIYRNGALEDVYWTFSYSPAFDEEGTICGVLVTCMETTGSVLARKQIEETVDQRTAEIKQAHESLIIANEYLQTIINLFKEPLQVLIPVIENDKIIDFVYKLTNQAYANYANTTPEALAGKRIGDVFPGYFKTDSFVRPVETYETGESQTFEIHYDQDGIDLYNLMSTTRLRDEVIIHFTDFTNLKHLQLELQKKIGELESSNRQLEEFAHAASHDLKEPIRKIQMFIGRLEEQTSERLSDAEKNSLEKIQKAAKRMRLLIEDLLSYSELQQKPVEKEQIDLNELMRQVIEDLELSIEEKQATILYDDLITVWGYKRQLQQAFQNLISNALKYNRAEPAPFIKITAGSEIDAGVSYQFIEVADNGIGFDPEYTEKIFQMFTRLHDKKSYEGTGIGLSIVKKIVENHNGKISVNTIPGVGSKFRILLPAEV